MTNTYDELARKYFDALDAHRAEDARGVYGRQWKDTALILEAAEETLRRALRVRALKEGKP